jgi:hypothetical protein
VTVLPRRFSMRILAGPVGTAEGLAAEQRQRPGNCPQPPQGEFPSDRHTTLRDISNSSPALSILGPLLAPPAVRRLERLFRLDGPGRSSSRNCQPSPLSAPESAPSGSPAPLIVFQIHSPSVILTTSRGLPRSGVFLHLDPLQGVFRCR